MFRFSDNLQERLHELRRMTTAEKQAHLASLSISSPVKPWPFGMPCSAAPEVVVVGVSPGNSPKQEDRSFVTKDQYGEPPTYGKPHAGFSYEDPAHYWAKVRSLCSHFVSRLAPGMEEDDCIALSGHLNLGTGQAGRASAADTDRQITSWVSALLNRFFQPRLIVCFGLNRIIKARSEDWNHPEGLRINWQRPDFERSFNRYRFRLWLATSALGKRVGVLMWPNHPSRHPFAGDEHRAEWKDALHQADSLLVANNL